MKTYKEPKPKRVGKLTMHAKSHTNIISNNLYLVLSCMSTITNLMPLIDLNLHQTRNPFFFLYIKITLLLLPFWQSGGM